MENVLRSNDHHHTFSAFNPIKKKKKKKNCDSIIISYDIDVSNLNEVCVYLHVHDGLQSILVSMIQGKAKSDRTASSQVKSSMHKNP